MSDTLTITPPPAPEGFRIVDCRPPKDHEDTHVLSYNGLAAVKVAGGHFVVGEPRYILERIRTDTERLDHLESMGEKRFEEGGRAFIWYCTKPLRDAIDAAMDRAEQP